MLYNLSVLAVVATGTALFAVCIVGAIKGLPGNSACAWPTDWMYCSAIFMGVIAGCLIIFGGRVNLLGLLLSAIVNSIALALAIRSLMKHAALPLPTRIDL